MTPCITDHGTEFRVWAPNAKQIQLIIERTDGEQTVALNSEADGYHYACVEDAKHGTRYSYAIDGRRLPDPMSAYQPEGVHGASMVVDFDFPASDSDWKGVPLSKRIFYELHIGTFTQAGTYTAAIERLDELVKLGITAVELLPLVACPGKWNWGYDGVCLFAPFAPYGTPEELYQFIAACHQRGLAVYLDVVYNHLGPEGNYLSAFGQYFAEEPSPWGDTPRFDGDNRGPVRKFFKANARHWIERYDFDGLRYDAIPFVKDSSEKHIINEIAEDLRDLGKSLGREIISIGESNFYEPEYLSGNGGSLDAIWADDWGHAANALLSPGQYHGNRYYNGPADFLDALKRGYLYNRLADGSAERTATRKRGQIERCVIHLQNHDTVGNSPNGKRFHQQYSKDAQCALAALYILYPCIPLIFMGEEFASPSPFHFFTDFTDPALRKAVEAGRAQEFAQHDWQEAIGPVDPKAFYESKLPATSAGDAEVLSWYKQLIQIRKNWQTRGLLNSENLSVEGNAEAMFFKLSYHAAPHAVSVVANLSASPMAYPAHQESTVIAKTKPINNDGLLQPMSCVVLSNGLAIESAR